MENFFIPVQLTEARQKKFSEIGVAATEFTLEHKENPEAESSIIQGFILQGADNKDKVLSVLKASELEITRTAYEGIYLVKCQIAKTQTDKPKKKTPKKNKEISVPSEISIDTNLAWDGKNPDGFVKATAETLYPIVKREIIIHPQHNRKCTPIIDGKIHIHLWAGTTGMSNVDDSEMPVNLFDERIQCRDWTGWRSGEGEAPLDDEKSGWNYASYINHNVFIHFDCFHFGDEKELKIYSEILKIVGQYVIIDDDPSKNIFKHISKIKRDIRLGRFVSLCNNRRETRIKDLEIKIEKKDKGISKIRGDILKELSDRKEMNDELLYLQITPADDFELLSRELDRLDSIDKVTKFEILNNKICFFTSTLVCRDPRSKKIHEIGEFKIEIDPSGQTSHGGIIFMNLSRKIDASSGQMNAPHVYNDGHACLGTAEPTIIELVKRRQFVELVQYLIAFIETANVDDSAGAYISKWPVVSEETRNMLEKKYGRKLEDIYR